MMLRSARGKWVRLCVVKVDGGVPIVDQQQPPLLTCLPVADLPLLSGTAPR